MNRLGMAFGRCAVALALLVGSATACTAARADAPARIAFAAPADDRAACAVAGPERVLVGGGLHVPDGVRVTGSGDAFTVRFTRTTGDHVAVGVDARTLAAEGMSVRGASAAPQRTLASAASGDTTVEAFAGAGGVHWKLVRGGMPSASGSGLGTAAGTSVVSVSVATVDAHRFAVVWVENDGDGSVVRMQTVRDDGAALGAAATVSRDVAVGGADVAFASDGRGIVVFVGATEAHFDVIAVPVRA